MIVVQPKVKLASVRELESASFREFMIQLNGFARKFKLREMTNWSKVWEYPWLWFNGLNSLNWKDVCLCDLGSELSPMPWYFASLGATVTLIETDAQYVHIWENIRSQEKWDVSWKIIADEFLPFENNAFNAVTSFSVIEHQPNKKIAIQEVVRVLKSSGLFALSFDICEPSLGMTFPEWNGSALTMNDFENLLWKNPAFAPTNKSLEWNIEDVKDFIAWHLQSARHHNYTVGAALLSRAILKP